MVFNSSISGDITAWQRCCVKLTEDVDCTLQCDYYSDNRFMMDAAILSMGLALGRLEFMKLQI